MGVKRQGREASHSPPSSVKVKECVELYLHSHNTPSWCGAQSKMKAQGQLFLYQGERNLCSNSQSGSPLRNSCVYLPVV
jgi:hypothetical protein